MIQRIRDAWEANRRHWGLRRLWRSARLGPETVFFERLISTTQNFGNVTWLGYPVWQNVLDLWTIQETISEIKPALVIETGTNRGGSARFYAHLFDLIGTGRVVTVDVEKFHQLEHPRITWLVGSSTAPEILERMRSEAQQSSAEGPVMVILDSDHRKDHVLQELESYSGLVTLGSFLLCQDGVIDQIDAFRSGRPGPLPAIEQFLARQPGFEWDKGRNERFIVTHHPKGWLRRVR
jgi:cephalosporin hydroxylase